MRSKTSNPGVNLFIDTISSLANVILFDDSRQIIDKISWNVKWNESSTLIPQIDLLLKKNDLTYFDLENIVVVNGPGSFTWVRTTVLAANAINFIIKKTMTAINYFDLYDSYPIIKSSSKKDCFFKLDKNSNIEIISNEYLLNLINELWIKKAYWDVKAELFSNINILEKIDYVSIMREMELDNKKQIDAMYIKKPNIS
jgi:tRNA threonylcarbamoyladenosine biosynthesis protein TsaB